jgi:hypothetical protein
MPTTVDNEITSGSRGPCPPILLRRFSNGLPPNARLLRIVCVRVFRENIPTYKRHKTLWDRSAYRLYLGRVEKRLSGVKTEKKKSVDLNSGIGIGIMAIKSTPIDKRAQ